MEIEKEIREFFTKKSTVISVDLFGSYALQRQSQWSDIDIAILCKSSNIPSPLTIIEWREELSAKLHKEIDLVCLNNVSPILGMQVEKSRRNILLKDQRLFFQYQMHLYVDYASLKELILPMEENILKRKPLC